MAHKHVHAAFWIPGSQRQSTANGLRQAGTVPSHFRSEIITLIIGGCTSQVDPVLAAHLNGQTWPFHPHVSMKQRAISLPATSEALHQHH